MSAPHSATSSMPSWSRVAIDALRDATLCPVCASATVDDARCRTCGADFRTVGSQLWNASLTAAEALEARQRLLESVPRPDAASAPAASAPAPAVPPVATSPAPAPASAPMSPTPPAGSNTTVQSVLATAGAGLFGVAAIVFAFFSPDLTDRVARTSILLGIAIVFVLAAIALSRRRLQFSAEAVGGLGLVFLALGSITLTGVLGEADPWVVGGIATLVTGGSMAALGIRVRMRVWLWTSLLALAVVPFLLGLAGGTLGVVAGSLCSAGAAFAIIAAVPRIAARFSSRLAAELVTLSVAQAVFLVVALTNALWLPLAWPNAIAAALCVVLFAIAALGVASMMHPGGAFWSFVVGGAGVATATLIPLAVAGHVPGQWPVAAVPAAAALGVVVVAAVLPLPAAVHRALLRGGALITAAIAVTPLLGLTLLSGGLSVWVTLTGRWLIPTALEITCTIGLTAVALALGALAAVDTRGSAAGIARHWALALAEWFAVLAALTLATVPAMALLGRLALAIALAAATAVAFVTLPTLRRAPLRMRLPLIAGAHALVALSALLSWATSAATVVAGIAIVGVLLLLTRTLPARVRFVHVGAAYAYGLFVFATALSVAGMDGIALVCLTTALGGAGAITATFTPSVTPRAWYAILAVTSVPFGIGVVQVVFERSGWTALSTGVIFLLALALTGTRRTGLSVGIRTAAAGILVPSLAVVVVCLGAQLLATSGSPVVLPIIAALGALALPSRRLVQTALNRRIGGRDAATATLAIEASTLLTVAIVVLLALVREAAGLGTTLTVLVILAAGFGLTARIAGRTYGWWLCGAALTGALWCAWGLAGVVLVEPYLLPPALGAALIAAVLTVRGSPAPALYLAGLSMAIAPLLVLLAVTGTDRAVPWRAYGLILSAWGLLAIAWWMRRAPGRLRRLRMLRTPTLAAAMLAGLAGAVQGLRWGLAADPAPAVTSLLLVCLATSAAGALPSALAARSIRASAQENSRAAASRWLLAPALLSVAAGTWTAIERDWFTIWAMWALMLAYVCLLGITAVRALRRPTGLPPVWFLFAIAFVTAVVAWSPRDLRVEWFSLPLGFGLLSAGALALSARPPDAPHPRTLDSWPARWHGSWALLAPGMLVLFGASVASTYTDPLTWRAILVIVLALGAIVVGATRRLAAPFLLGIIVLPVENVLAFLVQIGRGIAAMPWWITLSVVGAVLLVVAVSYERRAGENAGIVARLRDLR
ncbi:SCO7613 C-terminal domain-containing membrane protein [Microbacterium sp. RD1]|uniref:SCO7613 C-terminal domain-containing membrane protein n=1 Tax=Microbacterium sp. RD1 TaxID=3457313 RepID=UPI003FA544AB